MHFAGYGLNLDAIVRRIYGAMRSRRTTLIGVQ